MSSQLFIIVVALLFFNHCRVENFSSSHSSVSPWYLWRNFWNPYDLNDADDVNGVNSIRATYHGFDQYTERYDDIRKTGNDFMDQHFYLCYHRDGTKTYYKKQDPRQFQNRRYWIVSASSGFVGSMEFCWEDVSRGDRNTKVKNLEYLGKCIFHFKTFLRNKQFCTKLLQLKDK